MGSKARIASDILKIILKERKQNQWFIDLFCGGCNLIDKIDGKRIANDKNVFLIDMWKGLQQGKQYPKIISRKLYNDVRNEYKEKSIYSSKYSSDFIGWIGWMASYNGRFFDGGYSGHSVGTTERDYISEQIKNTMKQVDLLKNVKFFSKDFSEFNFIEPCLIYCDIPYKDTKQYLTSKKFDHDKFWQWCRDIKQKGHTIFISEYQAPSDFKCVWEKEITNSMNTTKTYRPVEKLFTI